MVTEVDEPRGHELQPVPTPWRLGWWQTIALITTLCFAAGVVGWIIGQPTDPSFNDADAGFLADMTDHHQGAIQLAFAYLDRAHDPTVRLMARDIVTYQSQEIGAMNGLLGEAGDPPSAHSPVAMRWMGHPIARGAMPGLATKAQYDRLAASSDVAADDLFTRLMIVHHAAGVAMARAEIRLARNHDVKRLAATIDRQQRDEIGEMNLRREQLGLDPVKPDYRIHDST
jgi:uncharacterized protein (DUF305 family)